MNNGFIKVATAIPNVEVANCKHNIERIKVLSAQAEKEDVEIIVFPELCISAYTCNDLFQQRLLLKESHSALLDLQEYSKKLNIVIIVGLPFEYNGALYNTAAVIQGGTIHGIVPKTYLPNYKEFYEKRWFSSSSNITANRTLTEGITKVFSKDIVFCTPTCKFGIEICEDMWAPIPPSSELSLKGAEIIFNLSADNEIIGKSEYVKSLISQQSARTLSGYVFSSCGFGESTQDVVFDGKAYIYENGKCLAMSKEFSYEEQLVISEIDVEKLRTERLINTTFAESQRNYDKDVQTVFIPQKVAKYKSLTRSIAPHPFVPTGKRLDDRCLEILNIQTAGLAKRLVHTYSKTAVVGISGGLDSTLALLVCVRAFDKLQLDRKNIIGVTMPGFGTTDRTYNNAMTLMQELGITIREISIKDSCIQHFKDICHDISNHDVTYENGQARERTQILMDIANQMNGMVIGTGDLSELALGWATYNGDHMSMYGVNTSIPKTLVKHLVNWIAKSETTGRASETLLDIVDTPISPELIPADEQGNIKQKTEDLVGPYELHDFFIYYTLRFGFRPKKIFYLAQKAFEGTYDDETIKKWIKTFFRRFFNQQFKRSCLPDGPKVGSCSLSPRGDWRMPSDASSSLWLEECENL